MESSELAELLRDYAQKYEVSSFIASDPIQFPHRYKNLRDIEVSAFVTSWLSYGNRKAIISKCEEVDSFFCNKPFDYIVSKKYECFQSDKRSFYRFFIYSDFYDLCSRLNEVYSHFEDLESAVCSVCNDPLFSLKSIFSGIKGIPKTECGSACKRLAMFLRWMVRQGSEVDFGVWKKISPSSLVIPLDVHVFRQATLLGLTKRKTADMVAAQEITNILSTVFEGDPVKGDFALFGYGINNK